MTEHHYLSTACLHEAEAFAAGDTVRAAELHAYCAGETGVVGAKIPAKCKFCPAVCECPTHATEENTMKPGVPCTCPRGTISNRCASHTYTADELAPEAALSATQSGEQVPAGGSGCVEAPEGDQGAICDCGHDGLDAMWHLRPCPVAERRARLRSLRRQPHSWTPKCGETCNHDPDDYPPLQETYPGSGIYE